MNMHARDTIDNQIMSHLLDRLDIIVRQMSSIGAEFDSRYAAELMGELLERVDIGDLLDEARNGSVERTKERIEAALETARRSKNIQDEILSSAPGFGAASIQNLGAFDTGHVAAFIRRASPLLGITVLPGTSDPQTFELRIPQSMRGTFEEFGGRTIVSATTRRGAWRAGGPQVLLDFSTSFLRELVRTVTSPEFGGGYGAFNVVPGSYPFLPAFLAHFQNEQGDWQGQSLMVVVRNTEGEISVDNGKIQWMLADPLADASPLPTNANERKADINAAREKAEVLMSLETSQFRHPNNLSLLAALEVGTRL
jgi:hypothetical protein